MCDVIWCFRHGFGDCHKPLADSAALIEDIVHQQMCLMVSDTVTLTVVIRHRYMFIVEYTYFA